MALSVVGRMRRWRGWDACARERGCRCRLRSGRRCAHARGEGVRHPVASLDAGEGCGAVYRRASLPDAGAACRPPAIANALENYDGPGPATRAFGAAAAWPRSGAAAMGKEFDAALFLTPPPRHAIVTP